VASGLTPLYDSRPLDGPTGQQAEKEYETGLKKYFEIQ
jgi:hypothetical protein